MSENVGVRPQRETLSSRERQFLELYSSSGAFMSAAIATWPEVPRNNASVAACQLMARPIAQIELGKLQGGIRLRYAWLKDQLILSLIDDAFFDIGEAFNANGELMPVQEMPISVRQRINTYKKTSNGYTVEFVNRQKAKDQLLNVLGIGQETQGLTLNIHLGEAPQETTAEKEGSLVIDLGQELK